MPALSFESVISRFAILNPAHDFKEEEHRVEVRMDPLLGDRSVYNPFLRDKAKAFFGDNDPALIGELVESSARTCIFCPGRIEKSATRYPSRLAPDGRIRCGEALLFPNLFAIPRLGFPRLLPGGGKRFLATVNNRGGASKQFREVAMLGGASGSCRRRLHSAPAMRSSPCPMLIS